MKTLFTLLLSWCMIQPVGACIVISGYQNFILVDRESNKPLSDVMIIIKEDKKAMLEVKTDSTGHLWMHIPSGTYEVRLHHPEYLSVSHKLVVDDDYNLTLTVKLSKTKRPKILKKEELVYRFKRTSTSNAQKARLDADPHLDEAYFTFNCQMPHFSRTEGQKVMGQIKLFNKILVYPNPVSGGTLYVESQFDCKKLLIIYNLAGLEVIRSEIVLHQRIDTGKLAPGIYFLKVIDENHDDVTVKKIVIP